ncbi:MAG TPA: hypothetical protein VMG41_17400 [Gemmatimonadales bacterium]|nr:hypothetical protein [Gemmatimonadales bacterium]
MRQTIRVERLLRESVQTTYCDLVTRSTGRAVRASIEQVLASAGAAEQVALLDFSEVGLVDLSCADEIVAKLLQDPPRLTFLVLQGLREEQLEAIEHVLEHRDLAALVSDSADGTARIVGRVSPDLRSAFLSLQSTGPATAAQLAERLGWPLSQAGEALDSLLRMRLARSADGLFIAPLSA